MWILFANALVCVASCMQRVREFGDINELIAKHDGEKGFNGEIAPFANGRPAGPPEVIRAKANMADSHYQEIII